LVALLQDDPYGGGKKKQKLEANYSRYAAESALLLFTSMNCSS